MLQVRSCLQPANKPQRPSYITEHAAYALKLEISVFARNSCQDDVELVS